HLRDLTAEALAAIVRQNNPPIVFQHGELLTRLRTDPRTGTPHLETLIDAALRGVLARVANWWAMAKKIPTAVDSPAAVVSDLANLSNWNGIPAIEAVIECPVFDRHGRLIATPGYHADAQVWFHDAGLEVPPVPENPTVAEVYQAKNLLFEELLRD